MNCKFCHKPIVLVPSTKERVAMFGGTAQQYTNLFDVHTECLIQKRERESVELMRKIKREQQ